jgi:hypothetical protein
MEPLSREFRELLKLRDPAVRDSDIDRLEALLAQRFTLDPDEFAGEIQRLDAERERLLRERMPTFEQVWAEYLNRRRERPQ